jgi:hypothetical protein
MVYELPLVFDRQSVVPVAAARAIQAHLVAHGWQASPAQAAAAASA